MNRSRILKAGGYLLALLAATALITTAASLYLAIWTHGDDATRWGGTSFVTFLVTLVLALGSLACFYGSDL